MTKIKEGKIADLIQDDRNLNKGTEEGRKLIEKSLRKFGAGRSVLIDKNNRIIAGNKTHENAEAIGMDDVIIVEMLSEALGNYVQGMAIVMRGTHLCKTMRGVRSNGQMTVAHLSGLFKENTDARNEFYKLIDGQR